MTRSLLQPLLKISGSFLLSVKSGLRLKGHGDRLGQVLGWFSVEMNVKVGLNRLYCLVT